MAKQGKGPKWEYSNAKELLYKDLLNGRIPLDPEEMGPQVVYLQRPEFADFKYENFRQNLKSLRAKIIEDQGLAASESTPLAHDRRIYPKNATNHRGEPRWEGSEAE